MPLGDKSVTSIDVQSQKGSGSSPADQRLVIWLSTKVIVAPVRYWFRYHMCSYVQQGGVVYRNGGTQHPPPPPPCSWLSDTGQGSVCSPFQEQKNLSLPEIFSEFYKRQAMRIRMYLLHLGSHVHLYIWKEKQCYNLLKSAHDVLASIQPVRS